MNEATTTLDLTPLAARQAIGRDSGLGRITARPPLWRAAGVTLLILTVASIATPALYQAIALAG
jgi:hypothetical protein